MLCRDATISAGSADPALSSASGKGCSHGTSGRAPASGASGDSPGPPRPDGSGRRLLFSSARRQALVAIRYSQVRSDARPSNSP
jgi:hypothetical protein